jgi:carboxymethylenebutenolidase
VLGIFGEKDHIISFDDVLQLRAALEHGNLSYQLTIYADAPHGWLNDTMPGRYRPEIAQQTWDEVVAFLRRTLGGAPSAGTIDWSFTARKHLDYDFTKNVRLE